MMLTLTVCIGSMNLMVILKLAHDYVAQGKLTFQTDQSKVEGATKSSKEEKRKVVVKAKSVTALI